MIASQEQSDIIDVPQTKAVALREEQLPAVADSPPAQDMRHAMMMMPVEQQNQVLTEYVERRNNFRRWLREQFEEGVHFGTPPGCGPQGNPRPEQWQHKPSLYAAGADLLCDLMGLRAEFSADLDAWKQLGAKEGAFVMVCRLYSRATGDLQSEGRGVRREGQKKGDANNAIKMAQKSAKVDAILNCYGLRDLYSQDLETPAQAEHENPERDPSAPEPPRPRHQRGNPAPVTKDQCAWLLAFWRKDNPQADGDVAAWNKRYSEWVWSVLGRQFPVFKSEQWTRKDFVKACEAHRLNPEDAPGFAEPPNA